MSLKRLIQGIIGVEEDPPLSLEWYKKTVIRPIGAQEWH